MINVHPEALTRHYGVHGPAIRRTFGQTGAGHPFDEDTDSDDESIGSEEAHGERDHALRSHLGDEAVDVPPSLNPFDSDADKTTFKVALDIVHNNRITPDGYGVLPHKWEDDGYPTLEVLQTGRRGTQELVVALPDDIWHPRAELWARGLDVMYRILNS